MSTQPKTIDDISRTKTVIDGTERIPGRDSSGDFKITAENMISSVQSVYIGEEMKIFYSYKPISSTFPWLCMSLPDAVLSTTNYSSEFIDVMRARKVIYDEFDTAVSSFSGTWSGSDFTLTDNAANNAMIAELYEDWLYAGSPSSGWRILESDGSEYNITGFTVASRIITVSGSPTGTAITIYLNRVLGSTTSCKHFSWAGLGLYQTGGNKISGLRRRDAMQGHIMALWGADTAGAVTGISSTDARNIAAGKGTVNEGYKTNVGGGIASQVTKIVTDGIHGTPRTGPKTEMESGTAMLYLYVGSYTAS